MAVRRCGPPAPPCGRPRGGNSGPGLTPWSTRERKVVGAKAPTTELLFSISPQATRVTVAGETAGCRGPVAAFPDTQTARLPGRAVQPTTRVATRLVALTRPKLEVNK
jgi:hypothetical protein